MSSFDLSHYIFPMDEHDSNISMWNHWLSSRLQLSLSHVLIWSGNVRSVSKYYLSVRSSCYIDSINQSLFNIDVDIGWTSIEHHSHSTWPIDTISNESKDLLYQSTIACPIDLSLYGLYHSFSLDIDIEFNHLYQCQTFKTDDWSMSKSTVTFKQTKTSKFMSTQAILVFHHILYIRLDTVHNHWTCR
jgi:hypothetical protein